jgi:hypothetical protein
LALWSINRQKKIDFLLKELVSEKEIEVFLKRKLGF